MAHKSKVSPALFVITTLCFLFPFVTVSCNGQKVATFSGVELATGTTVEQPQVFGPRHCSVRLAALHGFDRRTGWRVAQARPLNGLAVRGRNGRAVQGAQRLGPQRCHGWVARVGAGAVARCDGVPSC